MSRRRRVVVVVGVVVGGLVLLALAAPWLVGIHRYKSRFETAASDATGMTVRVGRLGMGLFPAFHLTLVDARIAGERGATAFSAKRARLWIDLWPLLRREFRLRRLELRQPTLTFVPDTVERSDGAGSKKFVALLGAVDGARVSISDGTLHYVDRGPGGGFDAADIDFSLRGKDGVFVFEPVTMQIFGGQAKGSLRVDVSGDVPHYQVRGSLPQLRAEQMVATLTPKRMIEGPMSCTASLEFHGMTRRELIRSTTGRVSLEGKNLVLVGNDIDRTLSRFESSQSFGLVDVGAVFLVGPFGLAATKGYSFANLLRGSGEKTDLETLVSDWSVERGVAQAKDVALATSKNRIALQGRLDFVHEQFADVTVAAIDHDGCASVRQTIRGSFWKPEVEKPHMLAALAGPALNLIRQTRRLLPAGPCEPFYSGSVAPPAK